MAEETAHRRSRPGTTRRATFVVTALLVVGSAVIGMATAGADKILSIGTGEQTSSELVVRASGDTGEERLDVQVAGEAIASIELTTELIEYPVVLPPETTLSDVRVAFSNDAIREGLDRNVTVDHVVFGGEIHQSEAGSTFVEGLFGENGCQAGNLKTERLHCNGYFQYDAGDVNMDGKLIVRAAGDTGDERFDVHVGDDLVGSVEVSAEAADYTVAVPADAAITDIEIVFANDAVSGDYDRNLFVDYVVHDGTTYQSEANTTYAEGFYQDGTCVTGRLLTERLHCQGFFSYSRLDNPPSTTTTVPTTSTTGPSTTEGPTTTAPATTTTAPATTTTTGPTTTVPSGDGVEVSNYNTSWCMGSDGETVSLQECGTALAAKVSFAPVGSAGLGQVRVNGRCLTPANSSRDAGVALNLGDCGPGAELLWTPADWRWGQTQVMLRNNQSGMCVTAAEWSEGAALSQQLCKPADERSQMWDSEFAAGMRAKDLNNVAPVSAKFHGTLDFNSFHRGTYKMDSWTHGDIAFYAPPGKVTQEMANRWVAWYAHMDALHRDAWGQDNFDSVYRTTDPNHGKKKVVALIDDGDCSCGNKQQAEVLGFTQWMIDDPENWMYHWVIFYEMNRGGPTPDFYARTTWPNTHQGGLILPHMMAALAAYEIGGPAGLERDVPGDFLKKLTEWRAAETKPLAELEIPADIQMAILVTILQEQGTDTFVNTLRTMATKPDATGPVQALCHFRDAVNATTGGQYNNRMTNDWRLPTSC